MNKFLVLLFLLTVNLAYGLPTVWNPSLPANTGDNKDWHAQRFVVYYQRPGSGKIAVKDTITSPYYLESDANLLRIAKCENSDYKEENGWVLLYEELGRITNCKTDVRFVVYNKYTGLMRVFYFVPVYVTGVTSLATVLSSNNSSYSLSVGGNRGYFYAADKQSIFQTGSSINDMIGYPIRYQVAGGMQWLMSEMPILYDPSLTPIMNSNKSWILEVKGIINSVVNINFVPAGASVNTKGQGEAPASAFKIGEKISKSWNEAKDWVKEIHLLSVDSVRFLHYSDAAFLAPLKGATVEITKGLEKSGISTLIPYLNVLLNVVDMFSGGGGSKSLVSQLIEDLRMEGTINTNLGVGQFSFPVPGSSINPNSCMVYNKPLGTFNLTTTPILEYRNNTYYNRCVEDYTSYYYICAYLNSRSFRFKTPPQFVINPASGLNQTLSNIEGSIQFKIRWNDVLTYNGSLSNPYSYWAPGTVTMIRDEKVPEWAAANGFKIISSNNVSTIVQSDFLPWSKLENTVFNLPVAWGYEIALKVKAVMNVAGKPSDEPVIFVANYKADEVFVSGTDNFTNSTYQSTLPVFGRVDAIGESCPLIKVQFKESDSNVSYDIYTDNLGQYSCSLPKNKIYMASYYLCTSKGEEKISCNTFVVNNLHLNSKGIIEIEPITIHTMKKKYNWVSFPSIGDRFGYANDLVDHCQILNELTPLPPEPWGANGNFAAYSFNGQTLWKMWGVAVAAIQSSKSYRIKTLPLTTRRMIVSGPYLDTKTTVKLYRNRENWLGYWIPGKQDLDKAFGANFSKVTTIRAENWLYGQPYSYDKDDYTEPLPFPSTKIRPLEFGKGYIVTVNQDFDLQWNIPQESAKSDTLAYPEPEIFIADEKADYTVIDAMDIPPEVKEIGVFIGEKCVGAVKVDESAEQILVYCDSLENKNGSPYTFKIMADNGKCAKEESYKVYNFESRDYLPTTLYHGKQDYAVVSFKKDVMPSDLLPSQFALEQNYPNPFNPLTQIKYSLSEQANIKIRIFNVLGNEVATLISGQQNAGIHKVEFDGSKFSSGLYFYNMEINGKNFCNRKMMLIK